MSTPYATPSSPLVPVGPGLSQGERVVDTFFAPRKTFTDILRSSSWWLPFVLMLLFSFGVAATVQKQVGFDRAAENQIAASPRAQAQLSSLTPEQRARQMGITSRVTQGVTWGFPLLILLSLAIYALVLWGSFNFGLGAQTRYGQVLAVTWYAALPYILRSLLTIVILFVGNNAESFDYKNPIGTNLAYFLPAAAPWLKALLQRLDLFELWNLVLIVLGMATLSKKTVAQSATIVLAIWLVVTLLTVGVSAAAS